MFAAGKTPAAAAASTTTSRVFVLPGVIFLVANSKIYAAPQGVVTEA